MHSTQDSQKTVEELQRQIEELQAQVLQSQKLASVGQLSSSITHEFNNILTTVINYAKMGLRHKDAAARDKAFNRILSAGQRAAKITSGMLAYARGKGDRRDEIDLAQVVTDVLILVEKDLQMHRVKLQVDILSHPVCEVSVSHLQQVVMNLVVNARQAMDDGGMLFVKVRDSSDGSGMGEISIRDTGPGIPADRLPKIFAPFYTTKEADEAGQGGTGLGLSFCREVIEAHKGRMRVESTVGQGTTFTLKLPLTASENERMSA
jgi:signal transduction histidine kinase